MTLSLLFEAVARGAGWSAWRKVRYKPGGESLSCMECDEKSRPKEVRYLSEKLRGPGRCVLCERCYERYYKPVAPPILSVRTSLPLVSRDDRRAVEHREAVGWALVDAAHRTMGLVETKRRFSEAEILSVRIVRLEHASRISDEFLETMLAPIRQAVTFFVGRAIDEIEWTYAQDESLNLGVVIEIHDRKRDDPGQRTCTAPTEASVKSSTNRPQKKRMRPISCPLPAVAK